MGETNPYAAPDSGSASANPYAPPTVADVAPQNAGLPGRIGVPPDVQLPMVCALCGTTNQVQAHEKSFRPPRPIFFLVYLAFFLLIVFYKGWPLNVMGPSARGALFVAVYLAQRFSTHARSFGVPLCDGCQTKWRWASGIAFMRSASFVIGMVAPVGTLRGSLTLVWLGFIVLSPSITRRWKLDASIGISEDKKTIDQERIWVTGVHESARTAYLEALPGIVRG